MNVLTQTADGSNTLFNTTIGEHYHSAHGALQESKHVFIAAGLIHTLTQNAVNEINILEVGFGTGLNFLLSFSHCQAQQIKLNYTGIEAFPLMRDELLKTGYKSYVNNQEWQSFTAKYEDALLNAQTLTSLCQLEIIPKTLANFTHQQKFDLLYFDAFSVRHQPEMWTDEMIAHACAYLKIGGVFVSYAITGNLKRALKACGFTIQKLPGAAGKREMLRAIKN